MGEGMSAAFHRLGPERIERSVVLGDTYGYQAEEARLVVAAPGGRDAELALLLASPISLRDTATARYDALLAEIERAVEAGEVERCVYGEYLGDGVPPECTPTPLSDGERALLIDRARTEIGAMREAVEVNHELFHGLLTGLLDFERCW